MKKKTIWNAQDITHGLTVIRENCKFPKNKSEASGASTVIFSVGYRVNRNGVRKYTLSNSMADGFSYDVGTTLNDVATELNNGDYGYRKLSTKEKIKILILLERKS